MSISPPESISTRAHYSPPWNNVSIIGIAGSSGSGKSSLSRAILSALNLPWVVIVGMDSFYKPLNEEDHIKAHKNELDLDAPAAIDFDLLVERLQDLKQGYVCSCSYPLRAPSSLTIHLVDGQRSQYIPFATINGKRQQRRYTALTSLFLRASWHCMILVFWSCLI